MENTSKLAQTPTVIDSYFNEQESKYDAKHQAPHAYRVAPKAPNALARVPRKQNPSI